MPIRILTALVNKITIRKAFYISSAFFLFSNQTYNHLFLFKNVGVIQFCCKYLFYLHIVNGRTNNGFYIVFFFRKKRNSLKFKSKLLYSLIYLLCEIILLTTFLEFSSLNKTTVFGFHPAYCN